MCLLALIYRTIPNYPVIVAANRDEAYDRQGSVPRVWDVPSPFAAPKDNRAGGTWVGCNAYETVVALTNRHAGTSNANRRSRGLLAADLLGATFPADIRELLEESVQEYDYNDFNLICAGPGDAFSASYENGTLSVRPLGRGIHVVANGNVDDIESPRVSRANKLIEELVAEYTAETAPASDEHAKTSKKTKKPAGPFTELVDGLRAVCADHQTEGGKEEALCVHGDKAGTLSSTILAIGADPAASVYLHSQGSPCAVPYNDYSSLLTQVFIRTRRRK